MLAAHWGLCFLLLQSVAAFLKLLQLQTAMHYTIFVGAVPYLWSGQNPFVQMYIPGNDEQRYLYSPTFGMLFYPFSLLPEIWGRSAFVLLSLLLLGAGFVYWLRCSEEIHGEVLRHHPWRHWALLLFGAEIFGAIYFTKIEIAQLGLLFICLGLLLRGQVCAPFFVFGFLAEFKFQTLPVIGLAVMATALLRGGVVKAALASALGFATAAALPLLILDWNSLAALNQSRFEQIDRILRTYWVATHYNSVYKVFLANGVPLTLGGAKIISLLGGVTLALLFWALMRSWREKYAHREAMSLSYLGALALGLVFNLLFSPMSQANAFVFLGPLAALVLLADRNAESRAVPALLIIAIFMVSALYSDLVPASVNEWARRWGVKPWGLFPLLAAAVVSTKIGQRLLRPIYG